MEKDPRQGHLASGLLHSEARARETGRPRGRYRAPVRPYDRLRCGATSQVLGHRVMAPSTLGTFLRSFTFGPSASSTGSPSNCSRGRGRPARDRAMGR
jgi:hypothetical protein